MTQALIAITTFLGLFMSLIGLDTDHRELSRVSMPEICDNAIDDDMDGLIDLNDPDCSCNDLVLDYFIPNPSFEDTLCCPAGLDGEGVLRALSGLMECVDAWDGYNQVGADLFHECINFEIPTLGRIVPRPVPDGNSVIGFGASGSGREKISEYISACLNRPFLAGNTYFLDFDLGISGSSKSQLTFAIFGASDCTTPFQDSLRYGCPANNPAWFIIDSVTVDLFSDWNHGQLEFTPDQDVAMIALGAGCEGDTLGDYYYLDNLVLFDQRDIDIENRLLSGSICGGNGIIGIDPIVGSTYQWYQDGVALVGETNPTLALSGMTTDNGVYIVAVENDRGCFSSSELTVSVDPFLRMIDTSICEGSFVEVGSVQYSATGLYRDTLLRSTGCDSIILLDLEVDRLDDFNQSIDLCLGDSVAVGQSIYRTSGVYRDTLVNDLGCDSIITTSVQLLPVTGSTIDTMICEGESYRNGRSFYTETGQYDLIYTSDNGCDSTVLINLTVQTPSELAMDVKLCSEDDTVIIADQIIQGPGIYEIPLISSVGCDSTVIIRASLSSSPILIDAIREVSLGQDVVLDPLIDMNAVDSIRWAESELFEDLTTMRQVITPMTDEIVSIVAIDTAGCVWEEFIELRVMNDLGVYVPNVFSPNADGANDFWMLKPGPGVQSIEQLVVFDRWGNLVYSHPLFTVDELSESSGWDGTFQGRDVVPGVYVFHAMVRYLNGRELPFSGDITVIR